MRESGATACQAAAKAKVNSGSTATVMPVYVGDAVKLMLRTEASTAEPMGSI